MKPALGVRALSNQRAPACASGARRTSDIPGPHRCAESASDGQEHGIYIQNVSGYKKAIDNIVFNNASFGIHAFPHSIDGSLLNTSLIGNIAFSNGSLGSSTPHPDILLGGDAVAISPLIDGNATYKAAPGSYWNNPDRVLVRLHQPDRDQQLLCRNHP